MSTVEVKRDEVYSACLQWTESIKDMTFIVVVSAVCVGLSCTVHAADIEITTAENTQQNIPLNQSLTVKNGGSVTTNALDTPALVGSSTDEGGNTITLENGAVVSTLRADDNTSDDSYGIRVYGSQVDDDIRGLAGSGPLAGGASNIIDVQGGSTLSTSGKEAIAIKVGNNNRITLGGAISTSGNSAYGVSAFSNNDINLSGSFNSSGDGGMGIISYYNSAIDLSGSITTTGRNGDGLNFGNNHTVDISGTIATSGEIALGMHFLNDNFVTISGSIVTSGEASHGIQMYEEDNSLTMSGSITTTGSYVYALYSRNNNNVSHISGDISATGPHSYAIYSGTSGNTGESSTFHFLSGASVTGKIHNGDSDDHQTSYLTFGYAKDGNNQTNLTLTDNAFSIVLDDSITSVSSGRWDGYFAGGTTALNGAENQFRNIFVGADSFDNISVPDGPDGTGGAQTANLAPIGGATATLNVSQSIGTNGAVIVGDGSTYNLSGSHTHTGTDFNVTGSGTLDLSDGGELINNASGGSQSISNLAVTSGTGTVSGTNALEGVTDASIAGTLNYNMASPLTIDTVTLSGTLNQSSANSLTLTTFNVASGNTASITGAGAGIVNLGTATIDGNLNVSHAITSTGTFTLGADDTYNLSNTHTHNGTDFIAVGSGELNLFDGGELINNASGGTQTITNLTVTSGMATLSGTKALEEISNANIAGTLNYNIASPLTIDTMNLAGTINQNSANTLAVTTLNVDNGKTATITGSGAGNVRLGTATVNGNLNVSHALTIDTMNLTVNSSGNLGGTGTIQSDINVFGAVSPGNSVGTLTITGDYTANSGSILKVEVDATGNYDKLVVLGTATLADGAGIDVDVTSQAAARSLLPKSTLTQVIQAGTIIANPSALNITDNSALLDFTPYLSNGGTSLDLEAEQVISFKETVEQNRQSGVQGVAKTLDDLVNTTTDPQIDQFIDHLYTLSTEASVAVQVAHAAPVASSHAPALSNQLSNTMSGIVQARQQGLIYEDSLSSHKSFWMHPFAFHTSQSDADGVNGFSVDAFGMGIGANNEYRLNSELGLAVFYTQAKLDTDNVQQESHVDAFSMLLFGNSPVIDETISLSYQLGGGLQLTETNRYIRALGSTAEADYTAKNLSARIKIAMTKQISEQLEIEVGPALSYGFFYSPSYQESGAGGMSLDVESFDSHILIAGLEGCMLYSVQKNFELKAHSFLGYDLVDDQTSVNSSFQGGGATFSTLGIDNSPVAYSIGLGLTKWIDPGFSFDFMYDMNGRGDDYMSHQVSAKMTWIF